MLARKVIFVKIKKVSELTGLTARAIRVYIDEELIAPNFTENYLGRRSFDFTQDDIKALKNIATLRKYGFSIDEIRNILLDSQNSIAIIENVKLRTQSKMNEYSERLSVLSRIEDNKVYTVSQLSEVLSQNESELALPVDTPKINIWSIIISIEIFVVVWLPFVLVFGGFITDLTFYTYPKFYPAAIIVSLLTLVPSISFFIVTKIEFKWKRIVKRIILVLCVLVIPYSLIFPYGIVSHSETTDFRDYRDFDARCLANRDQVFYDLFPIWPHYFENVKNENGDWETVYLDAEYYYFYRVGFDYTYDIYAEWPLEEDKFVAEIQRVKDVFEKAATENIYGYKLAEMEKGDFSCLILYGGLNSGELFQKATGSYDYLIFAYNEKENTVRYINCVSLEDGADQPYYLKLDW